MATEQPFDYINWQKRLSFTNAQAADALDVSISFYLLLKRKGVGRKIYAWAAYGIECADIAARPKL